jgi:3-deoxy-D-manno-octulosonic-acid transferase
MRDFLARQAVIQVGDEFELGQAVRDLLASDPARRELGERARKTFESGLHAADRTARALVQSLDQKP